ncbi:hypothetical protein ACWD4P_26820 [Kitasatospora sp. NPDC002543]
MHGRAPSGPPPGRPGGSLPGCATRGGVTEDGRAADVAVTATVSADVGQRMSDAVEAALCG